MKLILLGRSLIIQLITAKFLLMYYLQQKGINKIKLKLDLKFKHSSN